MLINNNYVIIMFIGCPGASVVFFYFFDAGVCYIHMRRCFVPCTTDGMKNRQEKSFWDAAADTRSPCLTIHIAPTDDHRRRGWRGAARTNNIIINIFRRTFRNKNSQSWWFNAKNTSILINVIGSTLASRVHTVTERVNIFPVTAHLLYVKRAQIRY